MGYFYSIKINDINLFYEKFKEQITGFWVRSVFLYLKNSIMNEKETMIEVIKHRYETTELIKYKPKKFEDYLVEQVVELRLKYNDFTNL
jgi:hypothetical protein